ncbi:MAG TPA: threonylcarbamoyl-AMP synthase [Hellea balneolensis]|uniref:L-threonylcarbamoyladenylate synthase n=1 Tax=Hellea balneolensis TaxID=287478 RepID=A0A7C5LXR9_9PROT|nr:threonylcarbamoyl-AMP synthase [Hellea balneolensis]
MVHNSNNPDHYDRAIRVLKDGGCVILPTETVYGLAVLAKNSQAIERIYALKKRVLAKPPSVAICTTEIMGALAQPSNLADHLIQKFWPGPLTLVLPARKPAPVSSHCIGPNGTIGVRHPDTAWARYFAKTGFSQPLVLTSANIAGQASPVNTDMIAQSIRANADFIIDEGPTTKQCESTILAINHERLTLVRIGALDPEDLASFPIDFSV